MYIRRKVFSVALDEYGEERLFSTNEIINEDDYLNEVMYSDYYDDLDERMFAQVKIGKDLYEFSPAKMKEIAKKEGLSPVQVREKLMEENSKLARKYKSGALLSETGVLQERKGPAKAAKLGKTSSGNTIVTGTGEEIGRGYTKAQKAEHLKATRRAAKESEKQTLQSVGKARYSEYTPIHREGYYRNDAFKNEGNLAKLESMSGKVRRADLKRALTGRNAKIAYGVGAAAGLGYGGYRLYKNHKSQED